MPKPALALAYTFDDCRCGRLTGLYAEEGYQARGHFGAAVTITATMPVSYLRGLNANGR